MRILGGSAFFHLFAPCKYSCVFTPFSSYFSLFCEVLELSLSFLSGLIFCFFFVFFWWSFWDPFSLFFTVYSWVFFQDFCFVFFFSTAWAAGWVCVVSYTLSLLCLMWFFFVWGVWMGWCLSWSFAFCCFSFVLVSFFFVRPLVDQADQVERLFWFSLFLSLAGVGPGSLVVMCSFLARQNMRPFKQLA